MCEIKSERDCGGFPPHWKPISAITWKPLQTKVSFALLGKFEVSFINISNSKIQIQRPEFKIKKKRYIYFPQKIKQYSILYSKGELEAIFSFIDMSNSKIQIKKPESIIKKSDIFFPKKLNNILFYTVDVNLRRFFL